MFKSFLILRYIAFILFIVPAVVYATGSTELYKNRLSQDAILYSPYKDASFFWNWNTSTIGTSIGSVGTTPGSLLKALHTGKDKVVTLAFATGTCENKHWGAALTRGDMAPQINSLGQAGMDYIIAIGGNAGSFFCTDKNQLKNFISAYNSSGHMVGLDLDLEAPYSGNFEGMDSLIKTVAEVQQELPTLRVS